MLKAFRGFFFASSIGLLVFLCMCFNPFPCGRVSDETDSDHQSLSPRRDHGYSRAACQRQTIFAARPAGRRCQQDRWWWRRWHQSR